MALLLVIMMVALVTILALSFMLKVGFEQTTAKSYADAGSSSALADSAVNLVIAQISQATEGYDPASASTQWAWASQPGAIRTYDTKGNLAAFYKLYSSDQMVGSGASGPGLSSIPDVPPQTWDTGNNLGIYTDLNSPTFDSNNNPIFPIIDPRAEGSSANTSVEGFSYDGTLTPYPSGVTAPDGLVSPSQGSNSQRLPMPVKWLYVLQNGTMSSIVSSANGVVTLNPAPSQTNPVVGRVAFWTDDETCKINVNTASEGTFWAKPITNSTEDATVFAAMIPLQNELQRTPGHPATTSLSTVFEHLVPSQASAPNPPPNQYIASDYTSYLSPYYNLVPRIANGGTQAGSNPGTLTGVTLDNDRLFNSVDEMLFQPTITSGTRPINSFFPSNQASSILQKAKFFLTTSSHAPEVNMFNLPKISVWPLQLNPAARNTLDQAIAAASTVNFSNPNLTKQYPYYFQRFNEWTTESNNYPAAPPGTNPKVYSSQDTLLDWAQIARNQTLYTYLQQLTSSSNPIPGFGGNFSSAAKYPTTCNQILTEMLDLVRSQVNTTNNFGATAYYYAPPVTKINQLNVVPLDLTSQPGPAKGTRGFGRGLTVSDVGLTFIQEPPPNTGLPVSVTNQANLRAFFAVNLFSATSPPPQVSSNYRLLVKGLDGITVNGKNMGFPSGTTATPPGSPGALDLATYAESTDSNFLSSTQFIYTTLGTTVPGHKSLGGATDENSGFWLYSTTNIPITTPNPGTMTVSIPPLEIDIYPGDIVSNGPLTAATVTNFPRIQTVNIAFNPATQTLNTPTLSPNSLATRMGSLGNKAGTIDSYKMWNAPTDVEISMQIDPKGPCKGDLRAVAALESVPSTYFTAITQTGKYPNIKASMRYFDWSSESSTVTSPFGNIALITPANLVKGITKPRPDAVPPGVDGVQMSNGGLGDWDNGAGLFGDGPFINTMIDTGTNNDGGAYWSDGLYYSNNLKSPIVSFSPSHTVSSGFIFGTLPTGVTPDGTTMNPWQSLAFCPNPAAGSNHPGLVSPHDHLFLELFNMPVEEPYALTQTFSTAGKINLNYQIVPFTYITRSTGIRAVMKAARVTAIPTTDAAVYKQPKGNTFGAKVSTKNEYRFPIDVDSAYPTGTLTGFDNKFGTYGGNNDIFKSASEICDIFLVPQVKGTTYGNMAAWWQTPANAGLTGLNSREQPYASIYPRVTTKSNTYTVYVKAQVLKQVPAGRKSPGDWSTWNENTDQVLSENHGSSLIERYIDPNATIPDFADTSTNPIGGLTSNQGLSPYYKWRVTKLGN